jgi:hypothetical protein
MLKLQRKHKGEVKMETLRESLREFSGLRPARF